MDSITTAWSTRNDVDSAQREKWRALWRMLLADGETPPASAADVRGKADTIQSAEART